MRSTLLLAPLGTLLLLASGCAGKEDDTSGTGGTAAPDLMINEILASNLTTNSDDLGEFDDWVEVYNAGTETADLAGVYLSDDSAFPSAWAFPDGTTLAPGDFLLVWCDDATGNEGLHATFKLDVAGDQILLTYIDGGADPVQLDWVQFGAQTTDFSAARVPDGSDNWATGVTPTPGASNGS